MKHKHTKRPQSCVCVLTGLGSVAPGLGLFQALPVIIYHITEQ